MFIISDYKRWTTWLSLTPFEYHRQMFEHLVLLTLSVLFQHIMKCTSISSTNRTRNTLYTPLFKYIIDISYWYAECSIQFIVGPYFSNKLVSTKRYTHKLL